MVETIQPSTAEKKLADLSPSLENPAVALCNEVWLKIHAATLKKTRNVYTARSCAGKAYRLAMPPLSGCQNICNFIACVAHGMLLGAIEDENSAKPLYAAQVALATVAGVLRSFVFCVDPRRRARVYLVNRSAQVLRFQELGFQVPQNNQLTGEPCFQAIENSQFAPNTLRGWGRGRGPHDSFGIGAMHGACPLCGIRIHSIITVPEFYCHGCSKPIVIEKRKFLRAA
jgi:hypothetical protein